MILGGNLFWGKGNLSLELHSADFWIFGALQTPSLVLSPKIPKNHESQTENHSVVDSTQGVKSNKNQSARSENLYKSFCYFLLSQKVESLLSLDSNPPRESQ